MNTKEINTPTAELRPLTPELVGQALNSLFSDLSDPGVIETFIPATIPTQVADALRPTTGGLARFAIRKTGLQYHWYRINSAPDATPVNHPATGAGLNENDIITALGGDLKRRDTTPNQIIRSLNPSLITLSIGNYEFPDPVGLIFCFVTYSGGSHTFVRQKSGLPASLQILRPDMRQFQEFLNFHPRRHPLKIDRWDLTSTPTTSFLCLTAGFECRLSLADLSHVLLHTAATPELKFIPNEIPPDTQLDQMIHGLQSLVNMSPVVPQPPKQIQEFVPKGTPSEPEFGSDDMPDDEQLDLMFTAIIEGIRKRRKRKQ